MFTMRRKLTIIEYQQFYILQKKKGFIIINVVSRIKIKTDTYRKDRIKIEIIPWVKEIDKLEKLVGGIEIFDAHAVEMEMDSGCEY